jgi:hypothetical protein
MLNTLKSGNRLRVDFSTTPQVQLVSMQQAATLPQQETVVFWYQSLGQI